MYITNLGFECFFLKVYIPICIDQAHWVLGILNMQTLRMTIHDTLGSPRLTELLAIAWTLFLENLKLCFEHLNQHGIVGMIQQHANFFVAPDTPRQTGATGDCGPWVCRLMAQYTGFMDFSDYSTNSEQSIIDFRHYMADLYWSYRVV